MPAIMARYYPPGEREARAQEDLANEERKKRKAMIDRYWAYYVGDHTQPLKVKSGKRDDNVIINLCGQAIDKAVDFFRAPNLPTITVPGETPKPDDDSTAQKTIDSFWRANDLSKFLAATALAGFVSGHNIVKLVATDGVPMLALIDARLVTVFWDIGYKQEPLFYRIQWEIAKDHIRRQDIVPNWLLTDDPQRDPKSEWTIYEYEQERSGIWKPVGEDQWPYPFAPIVDWPNMPLPFEYYGLSDLRHLALNDSVNFVASNTARIIKSHAHPKTFLFGAELGENAKQSIEGVWELPSEAKVQNLEMQGDLASSMNMLAALRAAFFTQMRVVDWAAQKDKVGALTNFGLRVLFSDMLSLTQNKRGLYGTYGLSEISRRAAWMMGQQITERPVTQWVDPLPVDRTEEVKAVETEQKLGFTSNRTLATSLGRDYDKESAQLIDEGNSAGDALVALMDNITRQGALV